MWEIALVGSDDGAGAVGPFRTTSLSGITDYGIGTVIRLLLQP